MKTIRFTSLCILYILLFLPAAYSQERNLDALIRESATSQSDTQKVNLWNDIGMQYYYTSVFDSALLYAGKAKELSVKKHYQEGEAKALNLTGMVLFELGDYAGALTNYFATLKILNRLGNEAEAAKVYNNIGNIYRKHENYKKALQNHYIALDIRKKIGDERFIASSYFNIANVYKSQLNYEKALTYYDSAITLCNRTENTRMLSYIYNNMANLFIEQGDYEQGLKMHFTVLDLSKKRKDMVSFALAENNIGATYGRMGKPLIAKSWLIKSRDLAEQLGSKDVLMLSYQSLSDLDSISGNYKSAYTHYRLYVAYRDSLFNKEQTRKMAQTAISYEYDKREALAAVRYQKNIEKTRIWYGSASIIALLLAILGFSLFYLIRAKKRKAQQLWTVQQQLMELKQEEAERELQTARQQMDQFLKKINEKNTLIEKISSELNILKESQSDIDPGLETRLTELRNIHILTNDDWVVFLSSFNKLYPSFTQTLKEKCPRITNSELRYLMLTKIGLLHKEMANVLGVSPDTVRVTWNRVRNKLNGTLEENPTELLSRWVS